MLRRKGLLPILVMSLALAAPAGARATTTIGSTLALAPEDATCGTATFTNIHLASNLTAPSDGVILRWRLSILNANPSPSYRLRVLQPVGAGYKGDGTGPLQGAPKAGVNVLTLPTPLPIHQGELIAVDCPNGASSPSALPAPSSTTFAFFNPVLADGDARLPTGSFTGEEVLINADIATAPSNALSLGTVTRDKRHGTATLPVTVPGPGTLSLSGNGILAQQASGGAAKSVSAAGTVNLTVAATGKKKRKLKRKGKTGVLATVTYTPKGDLPGTPNTQTAQITLRKRHKKR